MKKIIFVHGYTASSDVNWYPNISRELDTMGVDYSIPDFPGGHEPHSREWLELLDREVKAADEKPIVLVGHSLGTRAILLYLQGNEKKFDTVILIAPPGNKRRNEGWSMDFFLEELDLEKLHDRAKKFIVVHSKDDEECPYVGGVEIAEDLGAELVTFEDRGHMSAPENYSYILEVLKKVL